MPPREYEYRPLMAAATLFVLALVTFFAVPPVYRPGAVFLLAVSLVLLGVRLFQGRTVTPMPQPRAQAEELELRTLDRVRDANLISRDEYEDRNDAILQRDQA